ncbi:hypothetical protein PFISCL1PPCAC_892, partial [Pristionchus fissidentatus]
LGLIQGRSPVLRRIISCKNRLPAPPIPRFIKQSPQPASSRHNLELRTRSSRKGTSLHRREHGRAM